MKIRLLNASGNEIASADGSGFNPSSITETVAGGVYYLEIDGVGMGSVSSNGYSDYGSVGQYFISGQITSTSLNVVDFNENKTDFKIFPNPSSKIINIQHKFKKANYQIITLYGAIVSKGILENKLDNFDVSLFAKGIYFLKIKSGNDIYTSKIIIK